MQFCQKGMSLSCLICKLNRNLQNPFSWKFHNSVIQSPKKSWHTSTWDTWYTLIFGKRVLSRTVEDDVLETTEGLPTKKAQPQGTTKHYTIQNYILRTAKNYYVQSTTPYHEVSTTTD